MSTTPIIRSTQNCNYSLRYWSHIFVQPPPSNVVKVGHVGWRYLHSSWPVPEAVVTVLCTPDDVRGWHPKHVQWTCRITDCFVLHLVGQLLIHISDARNHKHKILIISKDYINWSLWKLLCIAITLPHSFQATKSDPRPDRTTSEIPYVRSESFLLWIQQKSVLTQEQ